jgi:hypothetical protein
MKKTRSEKSRDTVPLNMHRPFVYLKLKKLNSLRLLQCASIAGTLLKKVIDFPVPQPGGHQTLPGQE